MPVKAPMELGSKHTTIGFLLLLLFLFLYLELLKVFVKAIFIFILFKALARFVW